MERPHRQLDTRPRGGFVDSSDDGAHHGASHDGTPLREAAGDEIPGGAGAEPIYDLPSSLARLGNDRQLLEEVINIFLEDAPDLLRHASASLAKGEIRQLERAVHSLKGLSANFAAASAVAAAYAVEYHAREGNLQNATDCFPVLEEQVRILLAALQRHRDENA